MRSRVDMKVCTIQTDFIFSLPTFGAPKAPIPLDFVDDAPVTLECPATTNRKYRAEVMSHEKKGQIHECLF